jgi:hypothetical protein
MAINNLSRENLVGVFANKSSNPQEIETKTSSYTLAVADKDKLIAVNATGATTVTIPADSTADFLVGSKIDVINLNTGTVTIAGAGGVTLNGTPATVLQFETVTVIKRAANTWVVQRFVGASNTQTLTNKTISGSNNTLSNIAQSSVTNLTSDLAAKANLSAGYQFHSTLYYTSNATFTKATYPWLRAIRVKCQGGGGGGAGAASTGVGQVSGGGSGGGSGYAERFITNISGLSASITVTVGAGGTAGSTSGGAGGTGGNSEFDGTIGGGGSGGSGMFSAQVPADVFGNGGTNGSAGGTFDFFVNGSGGGAFIAPSTIRVYVAHSGASHLGGGLAGLVESTSGAGTNATNYGSGGRSARNVSSDATGRLGGTGAPGIVIVELYA